MRNLGSTGRFAARARFAAAVLAAALLAGTAGSDAQAAIAFVQQVGSNTSKTVGTSLAVTLAAGVNVTVGDTLLVGFAMDPGAGGPATARPPA